MIDDEDFWRTKHHDVWLSDVQEVCCIALINQIATISIHVGGVISYTFMSFKKDISGRRIAILNEKCFIPLL